jgi:ATP-binding cassette subfamily C protein
VTGRLPVADRVQVRRAAWRLLRQDRRAFLAVLTLYSLTGLAVLPGPWLAGEIVDRVRAGAGVSTVDRLALAIAGFVVAQLLLERTARYAGHRFGERALARLREGLVERTLGLPLPVVERAGGGDLMTRSTSDVALVAPALRDAAPEVLLASVQVVLVTGAVFLLHPVLGLVALATLPLMSVVTRWYLRRARDAYLAEGAADTEVSEELSASTEGARTVEALRLAGRRIAAGDATVAGGVATRRRTLFLRSVFFPGLDVGFAVPMATMLGLGGALHLAGVVSLGAVVAGVLYLQRMADPMYAVMEWVEQVQRGAAAFARVEGVGLVPPDRAATGAVPAGDQLEVAGVRFAYRPGHDVLHGVDLRPRPGERLAVVGPSGAGKSTLGRLLAGVDPPRTGRVTVGGVPVTHLPVTELRRLVVLVTQEHHVFIGTLRDNLAAASPATDAELLAALATVGAGWVRDLPDGLDTVLRAGGVELDPGQAQQLALARLILADPDTVVLDEATSALDPTSARRTEQALAAALAGRTVVAIAHRLQTAHAADRVAVVEGGRVTELGSHHELVAAGGSYAALWRAWHGADPAGQRHPGPRSGSLATPPNGGLTTQRDRSSLNVTSVDGEFC